MNTKNTVSLMATPVLISALLLGGNVRAEDNPLQFYTNDNGSYAKLTLEADLAVFAQSNSHFGNNIYDSESWWESLVRPGVDVNFVMPDKQSIYGKFDVIQANTFGGNDAAGSNVGYTESSVRIDHAYAGWKSGNLFSALGEDFLDISFGRQNYLVGNGFLFASEGGSGWGRPAYWIGGRKSADYAAIIKMKSGKWSGDLVYFEADDNPDSDTKVGGGNVAYTAEGMGFLGAGVYSVESDIASRDSMVVYNLRGGVQPFALMGGADVLKPLKLEAEYVYEDTDSGYQSGNAWYASIGYQFETCPWKPTATYRYTSFDQDYDYLYYGSTDWETWYQGEILGEYILWNTDMDSHMLKLTLQPLDTVTVSLAYLNFNRHQSDKDYAQEYECIVDWAVNTHLSLSVVGGIADPDEAAIAETGGNENWSYMMLFASLKF